MTESRATGGLNRAFCFVSPTKKVTSDHIIDRKVSLASPSRIHLAAIHLAFRQPPHQCCSDLFYLMRKTILSLLSHCFSLLHDLHFFFTS